MEEKEPTYSYASTHRKLSHLLMNKEEVGKVPAIRRKADTADRLVEVEVMDNGSCSKADKQGGTIWDNKLFKNIRMIKVFLFNSS